MALAPGREVVVLGVGLHPFGRFSEKDLAGLARDAVVEALGDAGVRWRDVQVAYFGHVYYQGMSMGEVTLKDLGLTGIPIINVENACSSGSTAFWQAYWGITTGLYDMALAFGAEKVPRGPVTVTAEDSPERLIGADHMMAAYALRARRYMEEYGVPIEALGEVAVKAHENAALNPYAHYNKLFTLDQVLESPGYCGPADPVPVLPHQRRRLGGNTLRQRSDFPLRSRQLPRHLSGWSRPDHRHLHRPGLGQSRHESIPGRRGRETGLRDGGHRAGGRGHSPGPRRRDHRRAPAARDAGTAAKG